MKLKSLLFLCLGSVMAFGCEDDACENHPEPVVKEFQPDAATGVDATIWNVNPSVNYGSHPQIVGSAWTNGGAPSNLRSLFNFDLSSIPADAKIESATLYLYHHIANNNDGHEGSNEGVISRVTQSWAENSVTWNNQPATTTVNQVTVPVSTSSTQNYEIDITALISDARANEGGNFGFMLQQKVETYYKSLVFASSDVEDANKRPKLVVKYTL